MKKQSIYLLIMLFLLLGCNSNNIKKSLTNIQQSSELNISKVLSINVDEELELTKEKGELRDGKHDIIDGSIFLNDNDEVSFKGNLLEEYSPITVKIGDNDEVSFTGKEYKINTMQLKNGDLIEMKDKNGKVFLEMEVIE